MISELASSQLCDTMMMKSWFHEGIFEALAHRFWGKSLLFLTILIFDMFIIFDGVSDCNDFLQIEHVRFSVDVEQKWWFP